MLSRCEAARDPLEEYMLLTWGRTLGEMEEMAVLTTRARKALPSKSFALPGKGEGASGKGAGSYPIPNASHARNALARVAQHGTPAEKATVRAKVAAKYPAIGKGKK